MSSDSVSFTLTHGGGRAWEQHWSRMLQGHRKLSAIYDGTTPLGSTEEWEALVVTFFGGCHHMGDWFKRDPALSQAAQDDALPYLHADPDLRLAAAISNTAKHMERAQPTDMTAYILDVSSGGSLTMAWDVQGQRQGTRDALDLADACLASWRRFMQTHQLTEPALPS